MFLRYLALQLFYTLILEFDNFTAFGADKMIVMLTLIGHFVKSLPGTEIALFSQAALSQQLKRSINSGISDTRMFFSHLQVEIFGR